MIDSIRAQRANGRGRMAVHTLCFVGVFATATQTATMAAKHAAEPENSAAPVATVRSSDERLLFYPGTARSLPDGRVAARIEAWVYERESRPGVRALLARYLKIDRDAFDDLERARYDERTQLFRFDAEREKDVHVIGDDGVRRALPRTRRDGRTRAELIFSVTPPREGIWLSFRGALSERDGRRLQPQQSTGRALWVPTTGVSVVSDIDDTIKDSNVLVRRELLLNTFVRPFVAVDGMAARYREFVKRQPDLRIHYVSGSPHQLYPALLNFIDGAQFPPGSMHLRDVDLSKELFGEQGGTRAHKLAVVRQLIADFPQRRFVLIGDSGEQDPEIYAAIAREFPQRVLAIWIRDVTGQPRTHPRYAQTFAQIDPARWHLFDDSARIELPDNIR